MGFNPRLAPYSIQMNCPMTKLVASGPHDMDTFLHQAAFAGQVLGAYACLGPLIESAVAAGDTTTWLSVVAVWKEGEATTTGVYATGQMCAGRETGEAGADNTGGAWALNQPYTLTNEVVSRRNFDAGDKLYLRTRYQHDVSSMNASVQEDITIQVDYIYGLETA
jgi:hypothetical protein